MWNYRITLLLGLSSLIRKVEEGERYKRKKEMNKKNK